MTIKILVLASNPPLDTAKLLLNKEIRIIEDILKRASKREQFSFKSKIGVRIEDLQITILEERPRIVHFCGHGTGTQGLVLETESGRQELVSTSALAGLFNLCATQVECVVLNACYSQVQAEAIKEHINYVVGTIHEITDEVAIAFTKGFYEALGDGESIERAYEFGCNRIQLEIYGSNNQERKLVPVDSEKEPNGSKLPEHLVIKLLKNEHLDQIIPPTVHFENDIFISYSHIDNQSLSESQLGWISDFHRFLEIRLRQLRGEKARILRDPKSQKDDYINNKIVAQFPKVALMVSVLSPSYVKSTSCIQELQEFCNSAQQTGGIPIAENKERIFKVIKTPVSLEEQPQELQNLEDYKFYEIDQAGNPHEFNKIFGFDWEKKFCAKLDDLARKISPLLETFRQKEVEEVNHILEPVQPTGIKIYLAETTFDLNEARDKIRRELQQRGHIIFPSQPLPYNPNVEELVRKELADCKHSIHLVGKRYGTIPEGLEKSMVELQYSWAKEEKQHNSEFSHLVWIPNQIKAEEARQLEFIECLQDEPELLQTSLENLKTIIQDRLNPPQQSSEPPRIIEDDITQVYLICDQRDLEIIKPVYEYLESQEWAVILPMFEEDEAEVRQYHQVSLCDCDAILFYYGQGNELWLKTQLLELQKAPGYGRSKPMLAQAIYIAGPETLQKNRFGTPQATVIKNFAEFSPNILEPFRVQLTQSQGGC